MMLFIIDIDGTVANGERRFKEAGPEPTREDKDRYFDWCRVINTGIENDDPVPGMATLVRACAETARVVYLTSREERHREATVRWLRQHGFPISQLIMRPNGSYAHTPDFKEASINAVKLDPEEMVVVIDDDEHGTIEAMCRRNGFTFLKARSGGQR